MSANQLFLGGGIYLGRFASDPSGGRDGDMYFNTTLGKIKYFANTAWKTVGSGAGGGGGQGVNWLPLDNILASANPDNANFEDSAGNWVAYADAAGTSPVDMTGGSPTVTLARTNDLAGGKVLNGQGSLLVTKPASNVQGQGVSVDFYVPPGYTQGTQIFSIRFKLLTGTLTKGDLRMFLYDATNLILITPDNLDIIPGAQEMTAVFQLPNPTFIAQFRCGIHFATTSTAAMTFSIDDVFVGSAQIGSVPSILDEVAYTPTFTGWGTVSNVDFYYRQVGDNYHIRGKFTAGTTTATEARMSLPNSVLTDALKIASIRHVGTFNFGNNATAPDLAFMLAESAVSYLTFGWRDSTSGGLVKRLGNEFASSTNYSIEAIVPISGMSSNNPGAFNTIFKIASILANGTRVTATPAAIGEYRSKYKTSSSASFSAGTDTAPSTLPTVTDGIRIYAKDYSSSGTSGQPNFYEIYIGKNKAYKIDFFSTTGKTGNLLTQYAENSSGNTAGVKHNYDPTTGILFVSCGTHFASGTGTAYAGLDESGTALTDGYFDVTIADNIAALALLDQRGVGFSATQTANYSGTSGSAIAIGSSYIDYDTHSAYNTSNGHYVVPVDGIYLMECSGWNGSTGFYMVGYKNGVALTMIGFEANSGLIANGTLMVKCVKGDILTFVPTATQTYGDSSNYHPHIAIAKMS